MELSVLLIPILAILVFGGIGILASYSFEKSLLLKLASPLFQLIQKISKTIFPHARIIVFLASFLIGMLGALIFLFKFGFGVEYTRQLTRYFGLLAFIWLFLTLTPGLLRVFFPTFVLNSLLIKTRRSFGLSTFMFALIHAALGFIYYYGGTFATFNTLSGDYQKAVIFGVVALLIYFLMAITSSDKVVGILGFSVWKNLHRLTYIATIFVIFHVFIRGSDFNSNIYVPAVTIFFILIFIFLEIGATTLQLFNAPTPQSVWKKIFWSLVLITLVFGAMVLSIRKLAELFLNLGS